MDDNPRHDATRTDEANGSQRSGGRSKPMSARAMAASEGRPAPVEPDVEEAVFRYESTEWIARVVGRAGGPHPAAAPLLLLGFWRADNPAGERLREALTVGRDLADLTESGLRESLARAREPPPLPADAPGRDDDRCHPKRPRRPGRRGR